MESAKLMLPLFYDGNFNADGHHMRAIFVKEVSDGTQSYQLWRGVGSPDISYPREENDQYILHVQVRNFLVPLNVTEYQLIKNCGTAPADEMLYGDREGRDRYFEQLREHNDPSNIAIRAALDREEELIRQLGKEPARQTQYISQMLQTHMHSYLAAKENGGQTFPDFIGAAMLGEIPQCIALRNIFRQAQDKAREEQRKQQAEEDAAYCQEQNQMAEKTVSDAVRVILEGGILKNEEITFYRSRYDSSTTTIVNYLMRQYGVDVPIRTQGWINEKLGSAVIKDGRCETVRFWKVKGARCSDRFFDCMRDLIRAVTERNIQEQDQAS